MHAARAHVGRIGAERGADTEGRARPARRGVMRLAAGAQVVPERLDVARAGEAAGHADDRDRLGRRPCAAARPGATAAARRIAARRSRSERRGEGGWASGSRRTASARAPAPVSCVEPRECLQHQQRVAAELEEVVEAADAIDARAPRRTRAQTGVLGGAARRAIGLREVGPLARRRRGSARRSSLPLAVSGSASRPRTRAGIMKSGSSVAEVRAQSAAAGGIVAGGTT